MKTSSGTFLLLIILLTSNCVFAQNTWKKFFNPPNTRSYGKDVIETYDKGYLIGGIIRAPSIVDAGWIVKSDINREKLYEINIGGGIRATTVLCMNKTSDGGFIVGGYLNPEDEVVDSYVMKFNACGEKEWCTLLESNNPSRQTVFDAGIYELPDGSYIAHRTLYNISFDEDRESLVKFNHDGSVAWINAYTYDPTYMRQNENGFDLIMTSDTCSLVTGIVDYQVQPNICSTRPFWYKVDQEGNLLWVTTWVTPLFNGWGEANCSVENSGKQFYYTAGRYGGPLPKSYIFKLNINGDTIQKYRLYDEPLAIAGIAKSLLFLNDTTLIIGTQFGTNTSDNWWSLNKTDTLGNIKAQKIEEEQIIFAKMIKTFDDKFIVSGVTFESYPGHPDMTGLYKFNTDLQYDSIYSTPLTYDSLCPHPVVSDTIEMPGNCIIVSMPDAPEINSSMKLKIYPNPASEYVTIEVPAFTTEANDYGNLHEQKYRAVTGDIFLNVYNLSGQLIKSDIISDGIRNYILNIHNWIPGMYSIQLTQKGLRLAEGKFIKI